jgi:hypothetical protein
MLIDPHGQLRWASASDQTAQALEDGQERLTQGPCMAAFNQRAPAAIRDIGSEPDWGDLAQVMMGEGIYAALSVPVELDGSPIGTLDIYSSAPWGWDDCEVAALQAYAGLVASLLSAAVTAQVQGRLANQLQAALEHRWLIEQAKGMLMSRERLDAQAAFERLQRAARSSGRRVADVARDVTVGKPLPLARRPQQGKAHRTELTGQDPDHPRRLGRPCGRGARSRAIRENQLAASPLFHISPQGLFQVTGELERPRLCRLCRTVLAGEATGMPGSAASSPRPRPAARRSGCSGRPAGAAGR